MIFKILFPFVMVLFISACASKSAYEYDSPDVGPVAAALDGSIDADPLAAEIDLSNEAAENDTVYFDEE